MVNDVFEKSVESYGGTIAIIVFGAWFGRVLVDTGIAGYIIKKTVELAGDKPLLTALLLNIVCALIFCSAFGVGSVMAIGMIVLPIMFSLGIDKKTAVGSYMLAVASGMYLNIAYVSQFFAVFPNIQYDAKYRSFAILATVISVAVMIIYIVFNYMRQRRSRAFAAAPSVDAAQLPWYCVIVPFVPIVMVSFFAWQPVPSFLLGILLGLVFTRNMTSYSQAVEKVQKDSVRWRCGFRSADRYAVWCKYFPGSSQAGSSDPAEPVRRCDPHLSGCTADRLLYPLPPSPCSAAR